jgi:uncharacterized membrane protein YagU involved in acid resistance
MNRVIKDVLFGMIGGIAGTAVIGPVMSGLSKLQSDKDRKKEHRLVPEPPPEKLARKFSREILGIEITNETKATAGQMVQWGYGIFCGGVYGLMRRQVPAVRRGAGLPFGIALSLFGPAMMLPVMGLTPPATEFPISAHARELLSHYAYAATVEAVSELCEKIDQKMTSEEPRTKTELRRVS